jgi:UDP-N-acetylglucosamine acyltransferase
MVAANSKIVQDIPPYILAGRHPVQFSGINALGLQRRGFSDEDRLQIKRAYKILFKSELNQTIAIEKIKTEIPQNALINNILDFIENSKRGII